MSYTNNLELAYLMGYEDALAKRLPNASKTVIFGNGKCHDAAGDGMGYFACSICGGTDLSKEPEFCHWCGAKVVDDAES